VHRAGLTGLDSSPPSIQELNAQHQARLATVSLADVQVPSLRSKNQQVNNLDVLLSSVPPLVKKKRMSLAKDAAPGAHTFSATVSNPNQALDENANNNQASLNMNVLAIPETIDSIHITLLTDDYANETYLELLNANGVVVWSEGNENVSGNFGTGVFPAPTDATNPLQNNTTYDYTVALTAVDCYTLVIYDFYGDGMGASQWGGTDGELTVTDHNNNVIYTLVNADFGDSALVVVKNIDDAGYTELDFGWKIAPNPAQAILEINWSVNEQVEIEIVDMFGKVVLAQGHHGISCKMNVAPLNAGAYILRFKRPNGQVLQQKLIKN
jgi:hypothetical protein